MTIISKCTAATLKDAASSLVAGNLVAFPTETVYGLGADATNQSAVTKIYEVKGRPTNHPSLKHLTKDFLLIPIPSNHALHPLIGDRNSNVTIDKIPWVSLGMIFGAK